ncbi:MAG TPA: HAD-IIA family hydrolase [Kofleriaceae bacterium]|nr:HAD-IIA family hydrolase [Kofleriaceae bacterium]
MSEPVLALAARYDAVLLDAFGVLVDGSGALAGAAELIGALRSRGDNFLVVTNDSSRLPETVAARLRSFGLEVEPDRVVTSGSLIAPYFARHDLHGARCIVLGPADSHTYVERAGGTIIEASPDAACDAVIVCDEDGYEFLDTLDATLSAVIHRLEAGADVALIQPNPDLIYPKASGSYGFTCGAATLLLEAGLARRFPGLRPTFDRLGKPNRELFDEACRRAGSRHVLMVGDQLETDIAGAHAAGLDSALVATGITRDLSEVALAPTFLAHL